MRLQFITLLSVTLSFQVLGCGSPTAEGPPQIRLGDSVCDECNMIISDKRWATATVVEGPRGATPLLFDDFNCQFNYENDHPELVILDRWSYCHATNKPIKTVTAAFFISPNLRTPMGSGIAAFASSNEAITIQNEMAGELLSFDSAWMKLGLDKP